MIRIAFLDGQGGGLGKTFIKLLRKEIKDVNIIALATKEIGLSNMLLAGADRGYSGEREIISFLREGRVDFLVGPIGILINGGINGEITENIAKCIFEIKCPKYIIPLKKHGINIIGTKDLELKEMFLMIIEEIKKEGL